MSNKSDSEPVAWQWMDTGHFRKKIPANAANPADWRALGPIAKPLAEPFVVRNYSEDGGPTIKGNGFDGLRIGDDRSEAEEFVSWVNAMLAASGLIQGAHDA